jgi:hypothetical protein
MDKVTTRGHVVEHKEEVCKKQVFRYLYSHWWCYLFWESSSKTNRKETTKCDIPC